MLINLHTHTRHSDGSGRPEKYLREAIRQGFDVLGFSDHSPVPFRNSFAIREKGSALQDYCNDIRRLSPAFPGQNGPGGEVEILLGLEFDFIPDITRSIDHYRKNYPFDYFIGSVHLVRNDDPEKLWFIDGPVSFIFDHGLRTVFHKDIRKGVTAYYRQIREMTLREKPEIIGHLDKIKKHNRGRFFSEDEPWYVRQVDETLEVIRESGCVVEVNTRGIYKKRSDSLFPGPEILKKIRSMNIPIALTSDAHRPHEISSGFVEARKLLESLGFRTQFALTRKGWKEVPLS